MKKDVILSSIIGFLIAAMILGISENLGLKIPYLQSALILFPLLSALGMVVARLLGTRLPVLLQAAKFLLVGALNTFLDLGVLNLLIFLAQISSGPLFAVFKGISFLVAVINSYAWNKLWTFSSGKQISGREFSQFMIVSVIGLAINVGTATFVVNVLGPQFGAGDALWANAGAISAAFASLLWNFLGYKLFVFKRS
ncbi:MAG: GtrA family protein [bacterium]|nr:GtrA family protein [bacterium]MDZ4232009.1 GtrA family protein [Candidatus Pacearchaeota archaeon]